MKGKGLAMVLINVHEYQVLILQQVPAIGDSLGGGGLKFLKILGKVIV